MDSHAAGVAAHIWISTIDATSTRDTARARRSVIDRAGMNEERIAFATLLIGIHNRVDNIGGDSLVRVTGFQWEIWATCAAVAVALDQLGRGQGRAGTGARWQYGIIQNWRSIFEHVYAVVIAVGVDGVVVGDVVVVGAWRQRRCRSAHFWAHNVPQIFYALLLCVLPFPPCLSSRQLLLLLLLIGNSFSLSLWIHCFVVVI